MIILINLGLCLSGVAQASERCELALQPYSMAPIVDDFVTLITNTVEQADSPLRPAILKSLLQTKQLELTKKFGPTTANQLLAEMQERVLTKISRDFQRNVGNQKGKSKSLPLEQLVRVFRPWKKTEFQHSETVHSAVFSPDGRQILASSWDKTAKLWDIKTQQVLHTFVGHFLAVNSAVFSPDGSQILTASNDYTAKLWDTHTGQLLQTFAPTMFLGITFTGHSDRVRSAVFSPDGSQILTASKDNTAKLWDIKTGKLIRSFRGHSSELRSAVFSPDGSQILTGSHDRTAKLWDAQTGKEIHTFVHPSGLVLSAVFSPDGSQILTAATDFTAKLWDAKTGNRLHSFRDKGQNFAVYSAVFSPDGSQILTASQDGTTKLWDVEAGKVLHTLEEHKDAVNMAVFSPDGSQILTASDDGTAILWNLYQTISSDGEASSENLQPRGSNAE